MLKLGEYYSKEAAIEAANQHLDDGYVIVVTEHKVKYGPVALDGHTVEKWFSLWGTRNRTVMTGGWNR